MGKSDVIFQEIEKRLPTEGGDMVKKVKAVFAFKIKVG